MLTKWNKVLGGRKKYSGGSIFWSPLNMNPLPPQKKITTLIPLFFPFNPVTFRSAITVSFLNHRFSLNFCPVFLPLFYCPISPPKKWSWLSPPPKGSICSNPIVRDNCGVSVNKPDPLRWWYSLTKVVSYKQCCGFGSARIDIMLSDPDLTYSCRLFRFILLTTHNTTSYCICICSVVKYGAITNDCDVSVR